MPGLPKNDLVFIDEIGVNTDMIRLYGRAEGGDRCVDKVSLNTPVSTTILSSIRLNGETEKRRTQLTTAVQQVKNLLII